MESLLIVGRSGRILAALSTAAFLAAALAAGGPRAAAATEQRVVLITIDGFAADNLDDPRLPLPNLRRMVQEGVRADRMSVCNPTVTWPNHTTLVTGVTPARHGVLANGLIEASTGPTPLFVNPRRSKSELCRWETVYDLARAAGMITAEVNWPVTRGAGSLTYSMPDHPDVIRYTSPPVVELLKELKLLVDPTDAAFEALGGLTQDQARTQVAASLLRREHPHLLLLHLLNTDSTQHRDGPGTDEARMALSLADRHVGDILQALREGGTAGSTAVLVTADHGFALSRQQIRPNARLRARGLIHPAEDDTDKTKLVYDAQTISEGGVAYVYVPKSRLYPELVGRTRSALSGIEGVAQVIEPSDYGPLGLPVPGKNPQSPEFLLAAQDGYSFSAEVEGPEVAALARPLGVHGYLASNRKMDALFVGAGGGLRKGARLDRIRNVDVAPTIARLLGLTMRDVDGKPLDALLQQGAARE